MERSVWNADPQLVRNSRLSSAIENSRSRAEIMTLFDADGASCVAAVSLCAAE